MFIMFLSLALSFILMILFFFLSKASKWEKWENSTFECGFSSYYYSRFSFSMHYFLIAMIFLFLDLELCLILPYFNQDFSSISLMSGLWFFALVLILGLLGEWWNKQLDWKF